jgi:redox-sensitive bicupin YhaK (pirin superfamily)
MMQIRRSAERGYADHGWLRSHHSFSFAGYHDPAHMGVGNLRVINEDRIAPGTGFGTHGHRDMEIVSYVLEGALAHRDDMAASGSGRGNAGVILPGDVQRMSAGTGVRHSEFNHAEGETHFLQIWLLPSRAGIAPGYEQRHFDAAAKRGRLTLVAAPEALAAAEGAVTIHADATLRAGLFDGAEQARLILAPGRIGYVHVARGALQVNGQRLQAGDAVRIEEEPLVLEHGEAAEVLVFDLAPLPAR